MSELPSVFEGSLPANADALAKLMETNDRLAGGGDKEWRRIAAKKGKFREVINGEEVRVGGDTMNVIIVDSAPVSRTYYSKAYNPKEAASPPDCWSDDTVKPSAEVANPQATRCADCPQNIKGSGQGDSRACRFSQRLAVMLENDDEQKIYQMQIAATSIFGEVKGKNMPMQGYARLLKAHKLPVAGVVTEMRFDESVDYDKLFFGPVRPLQEEELNAVLKLRESDEVRDALHLTVSQTDGVQAKPAEEAGDEKVKELFPDAKKEPVEEPKKMTKKKAAAPPEEADLIETIGEWDD